MSSPLWFVTRATGVVTFLLLTVVLALGVLSTRREFAGPRWPRFVTQSLHRNAALFTIGLLVVHVVTTIVDGYVDIGWATAVVPFSSNYERFGVSLGTTAADLILVLVGTSLLRTRMSGPAWRRVHLSAYLVWPLALTHFLLTGTDAKHDRWGIWLALSCTAAVLAAVTLRLRTPDSRPAPVRSVVGAVR